MYEYSTLLQQSYKSRNYNKKNSSLSCGKFSYVIHSLEGKSDKEFLDEILHKDKYDKRILPPVHGKS